MAYSDFKDHKMLGSPREFPESRNDDQFPQPLRFFYGKLVSHRATHAIPNDISTVYLSPTTIKKIMALNRRVHLAPQRPVTIVEEHDPREGPKKSRSPFERIFVDFRYLDAKPGGAQLYSCTLLEGFSRVILAGSLTTDQNAGVRIHHEMYPKGRPWQNLIES